MDVLQIDIVNPKALGLIMELQELKLIKVRQEPATALKAYLSNMRKQGATAPAPEEIAQIVKQVRASRHAKATKAGNHTN
jgi:hypothetical protein